MPKKQQRISQWLRAHSFTGKVAGHVVVMAALAVMFLGAGFGSKIIGASAATVCASGDTAYSVSLGDTLGAIAQNNNTSVAQLASYNKISNPDFILIGQTICIPGSKASSVQTSAQVNSNGYTPLSAHVASATYGTRNLFAYGQCTYWANERYHQLHGVYVPWTINADAGQWAARAIQFHWRVSSMAKAGSIIVIAPGVQGAWSAGHVGVVEKISGNNLTVSNMNWNNSGSSVTDWTFHPGAGVSFVTNY